MDDSGEESPPGQPPRPATAGVVVVHPGLRTGAQPLVIAPYPIWMPRPAGVVPAPPQAKTAQGARALDSSIRAWMVASVFGTIIALGFLLAATVPPVLGGFAAVPFLVVVAVAAVVVIGFPSAGLFAYARWIQAIVLFRRGRGELPDPHRENIDVASMHFGMSATMGVLGIFLPMMISSVSVDPGMDPTGENLRMRGTLTVLAAVLLPFMSALTRGRCNVHLLRSLLPRDAQPLLRQYMILEVAGSIFGACIVGAVPLPPIGYLAGNQIFLPSMAGAVAFFAFHRLRWAIRAAQGELRRRPDRLPADDSDRPALVIEEHVDLPGAG